MLQSVFRPYALRFKKPFTISHGTRNYTDAVLIRLSSGGKHGYGECTLPPYLEENVLSVLDFLERCDPLLKTISPENDLVPVINAIQAMDKNNNAAKAGVEMALWDLYGKIRHQSTASMLGEGNKQPLCTYTLGIASDRETLSDIHDADAFGILKIKLNGTNDKERIAYIKKRAAKRMMVDVNGGWRNKEEALENSLWMNQNGIELIEQPFPRMAYDDSKWLSERSPVPVIGDESIRDLDDFKRHGDCFRGINIKLMKCGGLLKAFQLIGEAVKCNKKILLGCMSESTCGVAAANQLASHADWVDLDGPLLIANDPFNGVNYNKGRLEGSGTEGNGVGWKLGEEFWK